VLVTGGAGYIGSHTVRQLRARGDDVVVIDSLRTGHPSAVGDAVLVVGSISDGELVSRVLREHEVTDIIHFAGLKNPGDSMADPGEYFRVNVAGTLTLIDAACNAGIDRFVFSSSCSVYGTPATLPVDESAPLHPESPYGQSKLMGEQILAWFEQCRGLRSVSLRYFNASGAAADRSIGEDWDATRNLVPLVMKAALGRGPAVKVFGTDYPTPDGTAVRDYVHVDDLAGAHLLALDRLATGGGSATVNLGTGRGASVQEVLDTTERVAGRVVPRAYTARRPGDPVAVYADNRAAMELLGWAPRFDLEAIIASAWRWHSSHPDGFRRAA
jgi:UDP-glucose-4-epimerase GalE